ncbi:MAG: zinc carboxypeptidase, partial [Bacteroidota bacterium]
EQISIPEGGLIGSGEAYAYAFEWEHYFAPALLNQIIKAGLKPKVATKVFRQADGKEFDRGTIIIPVQRQSLEAEVIRELIEQQSLATGVPVYLLQSGYAKGVNLGSNSFSTIAPKKVMLLAGDNVSSYEAGEVWHLLDQRYEIDLSIVDTDDFGRINLSNYQVIIMPSGSYNPIRSQGSKLSEWIAAGGTLIAWKSALNWLNMQGIANFDFEKRIGGEMPDQLAYGERSNRQGAQVIGGAIVEGRLDLTHPLAYGYKRASLPLFKNSSVILRPSANPYANPILYGAEPLLSGYISDSNQEAIAEQAAAQIVKRGRGRVVALADNPNFRAFWYGTNRLMINAIYFGDLMN